MNLLRPRWALISRDQWGMVKVQRRYVLRASAVRDMIISTNRHPHPERAPYAVDVTDGGPRVLRRQRVMEVLRERGAQSVRSVSSRTALSPECVQETMLQLGREGWISFRLRQVVELGEEHTVGVWRELGGRDWPQRHRPRLPR